MLSLLSLLAACGGDDPPPVAPPPSGQPPATVYQPVTDGAKTSLMWSPVPGATSYQVWKGDNDVSAQAALLAENVTGNRYDDPLTRLGVPFSYWIKACGSQGCSEFSTAIRFPAKRLNDTGIDYGGDPANGAGGAHGANCATTVMATQDCRHGRDALARAGRLVKAGAGRAGFDFTKLGADGAPLAIQDAAFSDTGAEEDGTSWSCVRDNHTGLVWEIKTSDGSIRDYSRKFRWGGLTAHGRDGAPRYGIYYDDWNELVNAANAGSGLCGLTGWRAPAREETDTILDHGLYRPVLDPRFFPRFGVATSDGQIWQANPEVTFTREPSANAGTVSVVNGQNITISRASEARVILVKALNARPPGERIETGAQIDTLPKETHDGRYIDNGDGTVTDLDTQLMWAQCSFGNDICRFARGTIFLNWADALLAAESSRHAGYSDWRVPNKKEMRSLFSHTKGFRKVNTSFFIGHGDARFWSSSPVVHDSELAWVVNYNSSAWDGRREFVLPEDFFAPPIIQLVRDLR